MPSFSVYATWFLNSMVSSLWKLLWCLLKFGLSKNIFEHRKHWVPNLIICRDIAACVIVLIVFCNLQFQYMLPPTINCSLSKAIKVACQSGCAQPVRWHILHETYLHYSNSDASCVVMTYHNYISIFRFSCSIIMYGPNHIVHWWCSTVCWYSCSPDDDVIS